MANTIRSARCVIQFALEAGDHLANQLASKALFGSRERASSIQIGIFECAPFYAKSVNAAGVQSDVDGSEAHNSLCQLNGKINEISADRGGGHVAAATAALGERRRRWRGDRATMRIVAAALVYTGERLGDIVDPVANDVGHSQKH